MDSFGLSLNIWKKTEQIVKHVDKITGEVIFYLRKNNKKKIHIISSDNILFMNKLDINKKMIKILKYDAESKFEQITFEPKCVCKNQDINFECKCYDIRMITKIAIDDIQRCIDSM